jgi:hypothetical protein
MLTHNANSDGVHALAYGDSRGIYAHSEQREGVVGVGVSSAGVKGESTYRAGL